MFSSWPVYVPVAERRKKALTYIKKMQRSGRRIQPIEIEGKSIAQNFWGKRWCGHIESFSDFSNRLPRGRSYVRNGLICNMEIKSGRVDATVSGSSIYDVSVDITALPKTVWTGITGKCAGQIGSVIELLQGQLSHNVMEIVTDREAGLFPRPGDMRFRCSCADWASMCKHVAAVLYGVGSRFDKDPEALFTLRGVDVAELISVEPMFSGATPDDSALDGHDLSDIFGIDLDADAAPTVPADRAGVTAAPDVHAGPAARTAPDPKPGKKQVSGPGRQDPESIRELRRSLGLSVDDFADCLGLNKNTVIRWEKSTVPLNMRARTMAALEQLGAGPTELVIDEPMSVADTPFSGLVQPESIKKMRAALGLSVAEFAKRIGVRGITVKGWEKSARPLKLSTRPRLALHRLGREVGQPLGTLSGMTKPEKSPLAVSETPAKGRAGLVPQDPESIRNLRQALSLSIEDFAQRLFIVPGTVIRWEKSTKMVMVGRRTMAGLAELRKSADAAAELVAAKDPILMAVADLRRDLGLSPREFARLLWVSPRTLEKWEKPTNLTTYPVWLPQRLEDVRKKVTAVSTEGEVAAN